MRAYNHEGRIWEIAPEIKPYQRISGRIERILSFDGPAEYFLDDMFDFLAKDYFELCIDAGGRNFGSKTSVYVKTSDIREFMEQQGVLAHESIQALVEKNPE